MNVVDMPLTKAIKPNPSYVVNTIYQLVYKIAAVSKAFFVGSELKKAFLFVAMSEDSVM